MKNSIFYVLLVFLISTLGYNLYHINYKISILASNNQQFVIGLAAGICALILLFVFRLSGKLKRNLNQP